MDHRLGGFSGFLKRGETQLQNKFLQVGFPVGLFLLQSRLSEEFVRSVIKPSRESVRKKQAAFRRVLMRCW
jgi:hypothetical protein